MLLIWTTVTKLKFTLIKKGTKQKKKNSVGEKRPSGILGSKIKFYRQKMRIKSLSEGLAK